MKDHNCNRHAVNSKRLRAFVCEVCDRVLTTHTEAMLAYRPRWGDRVGQHARIPQMLMIQPPIMPRPFPGQAQETRP